MSLSDKIIVYICVWHQYDNRLSQPNGHSFIHLWKLVEENLTKMESRGQKVILLCRYLSTSTQIPKRDCISDRKWHSSLLLRAAPKIIFSLALNSSTVRDCHNSANGKLRRIWLFEALRTVAFQAPLSMALSKQEHWNALAFPPPGNFPDRGIEPVSLRSPALPGVFFTTSTT